MDSLLLAFQFLTIIPFKIKNAAPKNIAVSVIFFPIVGLFLGFLLVLLNYLLSGLDFPAIAINIILVVTLIIITGGLHLDGLSDSADGLMSGKPKEEMLAVMRDPHIGVMGVLSLIVIILLKLALLISLNPGNKMPGLLLMCVLSRWSCVLGVYLFSYARKDGKARSFIEGMNSRIFLASTLTVLILAWMIWGVNGVMALIIIAAFLYLFGKFISNKLGGITGDILGAMVEMTEVLTLFIVSNS